MESRRESEKTSIKLEPSWITNVSTGALELCFLSGSTSPILPTMLGGSAPSQGSGAPFSSGSGSRASVWSQAPHQNLLFNRGYGIYSLFPGPSDTSKTLYTSNTKTTHTATSYQNFVGNQKVAEPFFPPKFSFEVNESPSFETASEPDVEKLNLSPKTFPQETKTYSSSGIKYDEEKYIEENKSKAKMLSDDALVIKNEVEELNKKETDKEISLEAEGVDKSDEDASGTTASFNDKNDSTSKMNKSESCRSEGTINIEPDSTDFKVLDNPQNTDNITNSENEESEKCVVEVENEENKIDDGGRWVKKASVNESKENKNNNEEFNTKEIELGIGETVRNNRCMKKMEKVESTLETSHRVSDKKYVKPKTPDSNSKISSVNSKKLASDSTKCSSSRTLSLPPHNGGCSRTTPVTFKHISQQEDNPRSQNLSVEVSPVIVKKEPGDFQKYSNGAPFHSPTPVVNFYTSSMGVLDEQLLSPVPYSDSFESSDNRKDSFIPPTLEPSFMNPSQSFLSPRSVKENSFLGSSAGVGEYSVYKSFRPFPKVDDNFLVGGGVQKMSDVFSESLGCMLNEESKRVFVNSTRVENGANNKSCGNDEAKVTPCQVAEVTSASSFLSPKLPSVNPLVVKQEASNTGTSPNGNLSDSKKEMAFVTPGQSAAVSSTVGVSAVRPRCQPRINEIKMPSTNVPPSAIHKALQSPASVEIPSALGSGIYTGAMTGCDDRSANLITTWPTQHHNPTLWQYSAPIEYPPFPPVGFQLVRDPITGHFLLIPASNLEALQRAILWPSYQPTPPQMIIPPISVQPTTPHLLLDTNVPAVDFLTPETLHHNTPPHRILITTENASKGKMPTPTLIKLEASECSNTVVVTACDNKMFYTKNISTSIAPINETVVYPQRSVENGTRSQATSPTPCSNLGLDNQTNSSESVISQIDVSKLQVTTTVTLQDASNQTDMPLETENERSQSSICKDKFKPYTKITEQSMKLPKKQDAGTITEAFNASEDDKQKVLREIQERKKTENTLKIHISSVPDVNIKKEIISPSQVDLSGLELLSNSIEQFVCDSTNKKNDVDEVFIEKKEDLTNDECEGAVLLQNLKKGFRKPEGVAEYVSETSKNLGGLGLLCALAEQRFQEEMGEATHIKNDLTMNECNKKCKSKEDEKMEGDDRNVSKLYCNKNDINCDMNSNYQNEFGNVPKLKKEMNYFETNYSPKSDIKLRNELNENNKEFAEASNILVPDFNNSFKKGPGRPKKIKSSEETSICMPESIHSLKTVRKSREISPPILEKETDFFYNCDNEISNDSTESNCKDDISRPPTLTPSTILDPGPKPLLLPSSEVNIVGMKIGNKESPKIEGEVEAEPKKRKSLDSFSYSSSKKRKVGRPKKHFLIHQSRLTETIVAKKPKAKNYLLQAKIAKENSVCLKTKNPDSVAEKYSNEEKKSSLVKVDECKISPNCEIVEKKLRKIKPKLKAEPKMREWGPFVDDENIEWKNSSKKEEEINEKIKLPKKVVVGKKLNESSGMNGTKDSKLPRCVLSAEHLKSEQFPIRTLTAMGGLFYAGQLSAIRAPDVYGITIDGERGNRPHIYSTEEILKDSILEVKPEKASDLLPGTRCCAYWSEQYRCLYPGTVSASASPDPELDDKFVNVEFDDGDSGKINIDDIRFLPEDYPIVEYDPNPLQSLSRKKRRISGASLESQSKERKSADFVSNSEKLDAGNESFGAKTEISKCETDFKKIVQVCESESFLSLESERKHLKKKRREKLKRLQSLSVDGKRKHKKHKCSDEHRHHKHHKKHRKHKHKHGNRHSDELNEEIKGVEESNTEKAGVSLKKKSKRKTSVKICKLSDKSKTIKPKKCKERTESVESRSKMAAFLPARQLWGWCGKGFRRPGAKGRARKEFYKTIQRGKERLTVGDCAVFLSTGRPDRPYIGRIESMWESWGTNMVVRVKWFYHPEETVGCPATLEHPGALFESPHVDENDVQTISHKCEVLPLKEYLIKIENEPHRYETIYDNNDIYYLAGYYDPTITSLKMEPGVNKKPYKSIKTAVAPTKTGKPTPALLTIKNQNNFPLAPF